MTPAGCRSSEPIPSPDLGGPGPVFGGLPVVGRTQHDPRSFETSPVIGLVRMPSLEAEIDAHFYELIHKLVTTDLSEDEPERRDHPREAFPSIHKVAPYDGTRLPLPTDFVDVCCRDLARGGFSYLSALRPTSTDLIVAFGVPPDITCVEARVVHMADVLQFPSTGLLEKIDNPNQPIQYRGPNGEIGVPHVLVSCQFVRRLKNAEEIRWS